MKITKMIEGVEVEISTETVQSRFGTLYRASNNYGEPKTQPVAYASIWEAIAVEEKELRAMLS